ncbi:MULTISPECIES: PQQ-binding-like beta-propeller repeat protein [Acidobacteriaceae]|uniref:outer membrane protein assembly factor BamB family protein n=1 Tax=Acidobacteriaceae TaxID=204434 RepID=UPI00131B6BF8|nr:MULTISPECIES: PQQ-binding-like beta-propeller repeat protein [Acidobacteriaceae]MDW5265325.1 PQQ-binding-like beta-propeller repeat protein [Edaphobacter sp.]
MRIGGWAAVVAFTLFGVTLWQVQTRHANVVVAASRGAEGTARDWPVYNGGVNGDHYSPLTQINRSNVHRLKVAWTFDTHEEGGLQTNPLVIGRTLYAYTPSQKVIAFDGATGKVIWTFSTGTPGGQPTRGLSYWTDGKESILFAGALTNLYALDPATGKPILAFGDQGKIDLRRGLTDGDYSGIYLAPTTPGLIFKDMIIVGFRAPEEEPALHGDIRAFDVHTGALRWSFHTIPHPGEYGYETWPKEAWKVTGAANNWAGMSLDETRGIVYAPTGSAVTDFYGYDRAGDDLFADTLLALDANTGKRIWHFQDVHHDIWDRDFPSPPALVTVHREGKAIDAVAQTTKQGFIFLFDRTNGKPLFPIEERPFPASNVPGETTSPTQPIPQFPLPYARQLLTADMLTTRTPEAHAWAVEQFKTFRSEGQFIPFSVDKQTVVFPGFDGGAEWGGPAVDPRSGVIYINANDVAWTGGLTASKTSGGTGAALYQSQCSMCHGAERKGSPPAFPSLIHVDKHLSDASITSLIHDGKARMPSFPGITGEKLEAILAFLKTDPDAMNTEQSNKAQKMSAESSARTTDSGLTSKSEMGSSEATTARYQFTGYRKFLDPDGYPAIVPPWGTLNAIDLNTGKYLWKIPLGEYPELAAKGMKGTGSENYGGPIVTAGGIVIVSATIYDRKIRTFDSRTGKLLWEAELPYAGNATPATYMIDGKQYVVIAASGARNPKGPQGAAYVAFALP